MKRFLPIIIKVGFSVFLIGIAILSAVLVGKYVSAPIEAKNEQDDSPETVIVVQEVPVVETEIVYCYETVLVEVEVVEYINVVPEDYYLVIQREFEQSQEEREWDEFLRKTYPEAYTVWQYLTIDLGLNNYVAAGIMGNLMNECGGNSLKLQPKVYGYKNGYYGICQWALVYAPEVAGKSLDYQLNYLGKTIQEAFDKYGYLYKKGFKYSDFCELTSCKDAADAFRVVYERPGDSTKELRKNLACYAYSVFVRKF